MSKSKVQFPAGMYVVSTKDDVSRLLYFHESKGSFLLTRENNKTETKWVKLKIVELKYWLSLNPVNIKSFQKLVDNES